MPRRPIRGLRTIVTGATSGIGRAVVVELVRQGARVIGMGRRRERLEQLAAELPATADFRYFAGDVTNHADRAQALNLAHTAFAGLDALINNAGSGALGRFDEADEHRLRQIMEVNFFAPAEFIREALPLLAAGRQPVIVNVSSVLGHRAVPLKSEYCASKFALHGLSDALRAELAPRGIDLLLVSPSTTASEFFNVALSSGSARKPKSSSFGAMPAQTVARRLVRAIAVGRRETILSAGGKALVWLDRLCPPLADFLIGRWG